MKKLIIAICLTLIAATPRAQVRTTTPGTGTPGTMPRQTTSPTGTTPGGAALPGNTTTPSAYPGTTTPYPGTSGQYPGMNTTTQPGLNTPGTGTAPRTNGTTTTPFRTYSDKNNLINNNPNPSTPAANPAVGNPLINGR